MCAGGWAEGPRWSWGSLVGLAGNLWVHLTAKQRLNQSARSACKNPLALLALRVQIAYMRSSSKRTQSPGARSYFQNARPLQEMRLQAPASAAEGER
jgi:hypothetical protein